MIKADAAGTRRLSLITTQNGAQTYVGGSSYLTTDGSYSALVPVYSTITSATTTSIDAAPAANTISDYDAVNIKNTYAGDHPMTLQITSSSGGPFMRKPFTLGADESMNYAHGTGFQFFDSEGNLKVVESAPVPALVYPSVVRVSGASYVSAIGPALATGNNDLYTVPAGKRALFGAVSVHNTSAGNIDWYVAIKISGTYYRLSTTVTTAAGAIGANQQISYIAEPGEILAIVTATNNGLNVFPTVVIFDNTIPVYSSKLLALANGDNTIYTVPSGKSAVLLNVGLMAIAIDNSASALCYVNSSGGARTIQWSFVESGQALGTGYLVTPSSNVNDANRSSLAGRPTLGAGDFVNINTNAATATQIAWVSVMETPA